MGNLGQLLAARLGLMKNNSHPRQTQPLTLQSGAAAVEFALIFPILLFVAYAGIVYSYVYLLQQSVNFAAQQGAQAAVSTVATSSTSGTTASRQSQALQAVTNTLSWLPGTQKSLVSVPTSTPNCKVPAGTFAVEVDFPPGGLFPVFKLPIVGNIPVLPPLLIACAVAFT